jgi:hypothetical protein
MTTFHRGRVLGAGWLLAEEGERQWSVEESPKERERTAEHL